MVITDFQKLGHAQRYYQEMGYMAIDVPWWATKGVMDITMPPGIELAFYIQENQKHLVASAEQSFLYMAAKGQLPCGKYIAVTPCFRFEKQDNLHRKHFMKAELIDTSSPNRKNLDDMIASALGFFEQYIPKEHLSVEKVKSHGSEISYDIMCDDVELGSYGIRNCDFLKWIYGTGCAEPRLSALLKKLKHAL